MNKKPKNKKVLSVRLSDEENKKAEKIVSMGFSSKAELLALAIRAFVNKQPA